MGHNTQGKSTPAKQRHKESILRYLTNPDNKFSNSTEHLARVCGITASTFRDMFNADEKADILDEALRILRQPGRNAKDLQEIRKALFKKAKSGDVSAVKLAVQYFEGFGETTFVENRNVIVAPEIKKGKVAAEGEDDAKPAFTEVVSPEMQRKRLQAAAGVVNSVRELAKARK